MASLFVGHAAQKSKLHNLQYDEGDNHMAEAETETVLLKCQTDLKFVYLFCQTDTFLFVIETPIRKCKHPFSRNEHLQNVEH